MALTMRRRTLTRYFYFVVAAFFFKWFFFSSAPTPVGLQTKDHQIKSHNFIERATRQDKSLNVQKHPFLQSRMGRDEKEDIFTDLIRNGFRDYWERLQLPYITSKETASMDTQHVLGAIDQLLSLNGWVAALCPTLTRPFGQNKRGHDYDDLIRQDHLYYIAIVIHSADHFLVDQLAVIVQLSKRLGTDNIFVSMLDYDSTDATETLTDLCEAVLTLLGVPFRIRRVPGMTEDPAAAYYPLEEAYMRNLALEPLHELRNKRNINFARVIWLKGFTCPNDILETIKISFDNQAAMVCGMDWAEHNGFFIFSDRWRTRDIEGDQFRQSKSSSKPDAVPPRDKQGALRYSQHLPFQVFCCESGTHVVDPAQSYYRGIAYRAGTAFQNVSRAEGVPQHSAEAPCLDSSQAWFCRDLWVDVARHAIEEESKLNHAGVRRRSVVEVARRDFPVRERRDDTKDADKIKDSGTVEDTDKVKDTDKIKDADKGKDTKKDGDTKEDKDTKEGPLNKPFAEEVKQRDEVKVHVGTQEEEVNDAIVDRVKVSKVADSDANAGSDYDAMSPEEGGEVVPPPERGWVPMPNSVFRPARILVNPRCPTTYAGVSHTRLAKDLFGEGDDDALGANGQYVLDDWEGAPDSFVCQEQRQTGGRKATKTQRRLGFSISSELQDPSM